MCNKWSFDKDKRRSVGPAIVSFCLFMCPKPWQRSFEYIERLNVIILLAWVYSSEFCLAALPSLSVHWDMDRCSVHVLLLLLLQALRTLQTSAEGSGTVLSYTLTLCFSAIASACCTLHQEQCTKTASSCSCHCFKSPTLVLFSAAGWSDWPILAVL